jgi:hypothetical protein
MPGDRIPKMFLLRGVDANDVRKTWKEQSDEEEEEEEEDDDDDKIVFRSFRSGDMTEERNK